MKIDSLPPKYIPFTNVKLGTNKLENTTAILEINGFIPFLIGNGETPKIWLSIPANKTGTEWFPLIKENFSSHREVIIETNPSRVLVKTPQSTVLHAVKNKENSIAFLKLDFRPFGLNIYLEDGVLYAFRNKISKNEFRNVAIVLSIGKAAA